MILRLQLFRQFISLEAKQIAITIPISVLSSVAKIFERLITEQLETYLESNSILVEQQAGSREKHSTQTSLYT